MKAINARRETQTREPISKNKLARLAAQATAEALRVRRYTDSVLDYALMYDLELFLPHGRPTRRFHVGRPETRCARELAAHHLCEESLLKLDMLVLQSSIIYRSRKCFEPKDGPLIVESPPGPRGAVVAKYQFLTMIPVDIPTTIL